MKRIAESTVRRLSVYLRFLEDFERRGMATVSSDELAKRGGTTSAQVRKDLSFFGSFGKRGLGYPVPELTGRLREILGLGREWNVYIVGAGKIGAALANYHGFRQRGFAVTGIYDSDRAKIGRQVEGLVVRDMERLEADAGRESPDIAILAIPADAVQRTVDRLVRAGVKAILNFAPVQVQAPADVTIRTVNMAMELEALSYALTNRDQD